MIRASTWAIGGIIAAVTGALLANGLIDASRPVVRAVQEVTAPSAPFEVHRAWMDHATVAPGECFTVYRDVEKHTTWQGFSYQHWYAPGKVWQHTTNERRNQAGTRTGRFQTSIETCMPDDAPWGIVELVVRGHYVNPEDEADKLTWEAKPLRIVVAPSAERPQ